MKALVFSTHGFDKPFLVKAAVGRCEMVFTNQALSTATMELAKGYEAIALFTSDKASAEVLTFLHAHGLRYVALRSAGHDHIDISVAKTLGIRVANVPAYSPYAIAEHAVALLMALNRKLLLSQSHIAKNNFCLDDLVGFDIHGKTVGVVGTGKIGSAFAKIMHGFGTKLLGYDIDENEELQQQTAIAYVDLKTLCANSDIISVCCPLNAATKYLFNKDIFRQMKRGTIFINTARGGIVHTIDLMQALDEGIIAAAGLDVYENEKPIFFYDLSEKGYVDPLFDRLRAYPNVLITGHQAFLTNEALQGIAETTVENISAWEKTGVSAFEL